MFLLAWVSAKPMLKSPSYSIYLSEPFEFALLLQSILMILAQVCEQLLSHLLIQTQLACAIIHLYSLPASHQPRKSRWIFSSFLILAVVNLHAAYRVLGRLDVRRTLASDFT